MKLYRFLYNVGNTILKAQSERLQDLQRLYLNLAFSNTGFRLTFFRKDLLNLLPHKLTSESVLVKFWCQPLISWVTKK